MDNQVHNFIVSFIWGIADDCLRDVYVRGKYRDDLQMSIKMKPSKIIIGLQTPQYERGLIISAAKIAGIQEIHELYINDLDRLDSKPISV